MKIFDGFAQDMAADLSGLAKWEVRRLRDYEVIRPFRTKTGYRYSFADVLMLRLAKQLRLNDVKLKDIGSAHKYLKHIDPNQNLTNFQLFVRKDTKEILFFGEEYDASEALISASKFGQLALKGVIYIIPVGRQLEHVRQNIISLDKNLAKSLRDKKLIPLAQIMKKYGLA